MKHRLKYHVKDYYNFYIESIEKGSVYDMKQPQYNKILKECLLTMMDTVFDRKKFKFEPNIGTFEIMRYKMDLSNPKKLPFDWKFWWESGRKILRRLTNEHTGGYKYFIKWDPPGSNALKHKKKYIFIPQRPWNKKIYDVTLNGNYEVPVFVKLNVQKRSRVYKVDIK